MKKIIFLIFLLLLAAPVIAAAEDAPAWQVFPIKWELALFNERIATDKAMTWIADRVTDKVMARLKEELTATANQRQEGPFVVRKDLEDFNKFLEERR